MFLSPSVILPQKASNLESRRFCLNFLEAPTGDSCNRVSIFGKHIRVLYTILFRFCLVFAIVTNIDCLRSHPERPMDGGCPFISY